MTKQKYFESLMIEPTNKCNLSCPVCPTGNKATLKKKGCMKFDQFKLIVDQVDGFLKNINLWGYGEPFLASNIHKMIDYVGDKKIFLTIHTNGSFLNKEVMDVLKNNYKVSVSFSVDGLSQETYGHYRLGGDFEKVFGNMLRLIKFKQKNNLSNLQIIWQFLVNRVNEFEVSEVIEIAKKINVNKLKLKTISIGDDHSRYKDFIPDNQNYHRKKVTDPNSVICFFVDSGMPVVTWDGNVLPCCQDYKDKVIMGNVFRRSLIDIWNNKKYQKFRKDYRKDKNDFCNKKCRFAKKFKLYVREIDF